MLVLSSLVTAPFLVVPPKVKQENLACQFKLDNGDVFMANSQAIPMILLDKFMLPTMPLRPTPTWEDLSRYEGERLTLTYSESTKLHGIQFLKSSSCLPGEEKAVQKELAISMFTGKVLIAPPESPPFRCF